MGGRKAVGMALAAALFGACAPAAAQTADGESGAPGHTLEDVAFMAGCWRGEFEGGGVIEERYTPPEGGLMLGTTRFFRGGRAVQFEFALLRADSSGVVLTPYPGGRRSEDSFRLTEAGPGRAVFEAPEHDFPKRIMYSEGPDGSHTARIDGGEGDPRIQEWVMLPVACEGV